MRNSDPDSVFRAANQAIADEDWLALVDLCDPVSVNLLASQLRWAYTQPRPRRTLTAEEYLKHDPAMPRSVAEYFASRDRQNAESNHLAEEFPSITSVDELLSMEPREVVAAWLQGRSQRSQIERQVTDGYITRGAADRALSEIDTSSTYNVVGIVMDGDRVAHVVYRAEVGSPLENAAASDPATVAFETDLAGKMHVSFMTCRKTNGEWRVVAGHDMFGLGSMMYFVGEAPVDADGV